jgi:hypothetical protein
MPSQSSNSNGGYSVTSSGTNSQVCIHNTVLRYTLAFPTIAYPNLKIQSNSPRSLPQISTYPNPNKQQGNSYDSRDYGSSASNQNSYHYSNSNGSYYYSNPNGKFGRKTTKKKKKKPPLPLPLDRGSRAIPPSIPASVKANHKLTSHSFLSQVPPTTTAAPATATTPLLRPRRAARVESD